MSDDRRSDRPLTTDELEKIRAESEKVKAETQKIAADIAVAESQAIENLAKARAATAEATTAELRAATQMFVHDREAEARRRELAGFGYQRIYHFTEVVREASCTNCMNELNFWHQEDPTCDIEIMFDSPGGGVFAGMALFDYIQDLRRTHTITTSTRGMAASMAGILLQAGDKRVMGAEGWILIHEISTIALGKIGEIEDEVELVKKIQDRVLNIFASRSSLSKETLRRKWRRKDWWIDSEYALKYKIVDEVRPFGVVKTAKRRSPKPRAV